MWSQRLPWFVLVGALLSALAWLGPAYRQQRASGSIMMPRAPDRVWANLGQANQLGDYLALGLVSDRILLRDRQDEAALGRACAARFDLHPGSSPARARAGVSRSV